MGLVLEDNKPTVVLETILVGPTTEKETNTIVEPLLPIACVRLDDLRFAFDSSDVAPKASKELGYMARLRKETPGMPATVFGHADPVGEDDYNKKLSGRRAQAIYGLLTRKVELWQDLYDNPQGGDNWGVRSIQTMLKELGHYGGPSNGQLDGPTKEAVKKFQQSPEGSGLNPDGDPGAKTRPKLFKAYMDVVCVDEEGKPFTLDPKKDFLAQGADAGGKGDFQGCSEFNPLVRFSKDEEAEFNKSADKTERNNQNAPNRRVLIFMFRPGMKVDPAAWPCPKAKDGAGDCKKRFYSDGEKRRSAQDVRRVWGETKDTFACRFYDRLAFDSPCEKRPLDPSAPMFLDIRWSKKEVTPAHKDPAGKTMPDGTKVPEDSLVQPLAEVRNIPDGTAATIEIRHAASGSIVKNGTISGLSVKGGKVIDPKTNEAPLWFFTAEHLPWDPFDKPFYFFAAKVGSITEESPKDFENQPSTCLRVLVWHAVTSDAIADAGGLTTQAEMNEIGGILEKNAFHKKFPTAFNQDNLPLKDFGDAFRNSYTWHHGSHGVVLCPIHNRIFLKDANSVRTVCPVTAADPPKSVVAIGTASMTKLLFVGGVEIANAAIVSTPRYLAYIDTCDAGFEPALANALIAKGTRNVIAFGKSIPDSSARQMARDFHNKWAGNHKCDPDKIADVFNEVSPAHATTMIPKLFGPGAGAPPGAGPVASTVGSGSPPLTLT
ncbi:MAG TPA: peptidoglycan-binding protein [Planctomycetota bacterium]|nr:peptidoglycan-binding protein [Planctomycetota bacterium]